MRVCSYSHDKPVPHRGCHHGVVERIQSSIFNTNLRGSDNPSFPLKEGLIVSLEAEGEEVN